MNWLKAIVHGLFSALFDWGQKQAEKPGETRDANTPPEVKRRIDDDIARRLRDKKRDSGR